MRVTVPCFAKLNLDLRVLHKRQDGFHELRTVFQTISLADRLAIEVDFAKRTQIDLDSSLEIADNLVIRAANAVIEHLKLRIWVRFALEKQIPMGAGLGGGSSDAAAVLIALPALAGKRIPTPQLVRLAESLGSDVPFFLFGGTALGLGRGTELYQLPDLPAHPVLVLSTGIHVSTAEAYAALGRTVTDPLTSQANSPILREFQTVVNGLSRSSLDKIPLTNDFEEAVFAKHRELAAAARKLRRLGAKPVRMTGSGSALFGIFADPAQMKTAAAEFPSGTAFPAQFVSRRRYARLWRGALGLAAGKSCFAE